VLLVVTASGLAVGGLARLADAGAAADVAWLAARLADSVMRCGPQPTASAAAGSA
jgi:hypothetical protein